MTVKNEKIIHLLEIINLFNIVHVNKQKNVNRIQKTIRSTNWSLNEDLYPRQSSFLTPYAPNTCSSCSTGQQQVVVKSLHQKKKQHVLLVQTLKSTMTNSQNTTDYFDITLAACTVCKYLRLFTNNKTTMCLSYFDDHTKTIRLAISSRYGFCVDRAFVINLSFGGRVHQEEKERRNYVTVPFIGCNNRSRNLADS